MNIEDSYFCSLCQRFATEREVTEDRSHDPKFGGCGGSVIKYGVSAYIDQKIRNSIEGKHAIDLDKKQHDDGVRGALIVGGMALVFTAAAITGLVLAVKHYFK